MCIWYIHILKRISFPWQTVTIYVDNINCTKGNLYLFWSQENITLQFHRLSSRLNHPRWLCDRVKIVCIIIPEAVGAFVSGEPRARTRQFSPHCPLVLSPTHLYGHRIMSPPRPRTYLDHSISRGWDCSFYNYCFSWSYFVFSIPQRTLHCVEVVYNHLQRGDLSFQSPNSTLYASDYFRG